MTITSVVARGAAALFAGANDDDGAFLGDSTSAPAAGNADGASPIRLYGLKTLPSNVPEPARLQIAADDDPSFAIFTLPSESPNGNFTLAEQSVAFENLVTGTVEQALGSLNGFAQQPSVPTEQNIMLFGHQQALDRDRNRAWRTLILPSLTVAPLGNNMETGAETPFSYSFSLNKYTRLPWGATLTDGLHGATRAGAFQINAEHPVHIKRYTGNNSVVTFNLDFTPIDVSHTIVFVDNVQATVNSVSTVNKTFTLASAPGSSAKVVVVYGFDATELGA